MVAGKKKPLVVVTRKLPDSTETRMRELFDTRLNLDDTPMTQAQLAEAVRSADILVPTVSDEITADILNQPDVRLKLIANFGNGVDNIDVAAAMARGIMVTNTPKVLTEDTADMTMALLLAVPRRLIEGASILTEGKDWPGWSPTWMGHRLGGKRLGIIGMGRIDRPCAPRPRFRAADSLSQPPPGRAADRGRVGRDLLGQPRPDAGADGFHFGELPAHAGDIPSALGAPAEVDPQGRLHHQHSARRIIDEATLTKLIEDGEIAGAALDVYEKEPAVNPKLVRLAKAGKVVLLPHMGSATLEGRVEMGEKVMINIRTFLDGHRPPDRVLPGVA